MSGYMYSPFDVFCSLESSAKNRISTKDGEWEKNDDGLGRVRNER